MRLHSVLPESYRKRGGVTIELEYRPDQVDEDGRTNHTIKQHHLPYNYCFLYDYENLHGHHLHNLSDYMEQNGKYDLFTII